MEEEISFGHFLKTRRKTLDLTQETLAQQVGCAVITIRKFESETRRPSQQMAARLADVMDLSDEERNTFIYAARQHAHHDTEEQEVHDAEEEDLDYSEDTEVAPISSVTPDVGQVPATSSDITLTIPKSRLFWVLTIGFGALVMAGLIGRVSPIVQSVSTDSEHREGMVVYPEPALYPAPPPLDMPEQIEVYPGPVHPDALHEGRATPGGLIETQILTRHEGYVRDVTFSSDGQFLASSGVDPFINIWSLEKGELLGGLGPHGGSVDTLSFSSDGELLASAGVDSTIKVWRLSDGHMLRNDPAYEGDWIRQILFNPDNKLLASISSAQPAADLTSPAFERKTKVALWRIEDGALVRWLETPSPDQDEPFSELQMNRPNELIDIAFSPDGQLLAGGQLDGSIAVWRVVDGVLLHDLDAHEAPISSLAFSPDSQTLVSGSNNRIQMWDVENGALLKDVLIDMLIENIVFSPDTTLFAAVRDTTIYMGQTDDGAIITALEGHRWPLSSLAFSPDNHTLASGSNDMTVRLWDIQPLLPE